MSLNAVQMKDAATHASRVLLSRQTMCARPTRVPSAFPPSVTVRF